MKPLQDLGLTAVAATELEFYLIDTDTDRPAPRVGNVPGTRRIQTGPQYGSMEDVEHADPFLADLFATCRAQNIPAGATLKEFSPGQFEINLQHVANAELVRAATAFPVSGFRLVGSLVQGEHDYGWKIKLIGITRVTEKILIFQKAT